MKLFLFGGAEETWGPAELKMIEAVIKSISPKQLLHVSFARIKDSSREERNGDRFGRNISIPDVEYLNANNPEDIAKANNPLVFISGGSEPENLIEKIMSNDNLIHIIKNADYLIGESAGVKVLGTHYTVKSNDTYKALPCLGLLPHTVLEGHYSQRSKEPALLRAMQETGAHYGVGIDSMTAMVFELAEFPEKYSKIGDGTIEMKHSKK